MSNNAITLYSEVRQLIDEARHRVAMNVNAELTLLYWNVGRILQKAVLHDERAEYGKQVITSLSKQLTDEYGSGWGVRQLWTCVQFAESLHDENIVHALRAQLSWTHLKLLLSLKDPLKRDFYIEMCRIKKWSTRQLQERIKSQLFERTAISRKPDETIRQDIELLRNEKKLTADMTFRDPYLLDFLGLADTYSEKDLESAILADLQRFLTEFGMDFAFLGRQKRIVIGNRDYTMDLLFFHRRLKCLVVFDLKIDEFEAAHKGQMELYLRYLEKHAMLEGENPPIGLILCADKNDEYVELLQLEQSNIRVAQYITILPPRELLQAKLQESIAIARKRLQLETEPLDMRANSKGRAGCTATNCRIAFEALE